MITAQQYFRDKPHPIAHTANFLLLSSAVEELLLEAAATDAYEYPNDPDTGCQISGGKGGAGDGGYRLSNSTTGATGSNHKKANAVDVYDPHRTLVLWCDLHQERLAEHGLYMEHPQWTPGWCHLQRVPPASGNRVYIPSATSPLAPPLFGQLSRSY